MICSSIILKSAYLRYCAGSACKVQHSDLLLLLIVTAGLRDFILVDPINANPIQSITDLGGNLVYDLLLPRFTIVRGSVLTLEKRSAITHRLYKTGSTYFQCFRLPSAMSILNRNNYTELRIVASRCC